MAVGIGGGEAIMTAILQDFGELGFGVEGMDSCIEFMNLILEFMVLSDVGGKPPVTKFIGGVV